MSDNTTLRQGLHSFYSEYYSDLSHDKIEISIEAKEFFTSHDIAHVLFGCDISLLGEGSVKIWTIFGTTLGFWNHIKKYKEANALQLSRKLKPKSFLNELPRLLYSIPGTIKRARRMTKPWPWSDYHSYLDRPISDIRKEFNIQIK